VIVALSSPATTVGVPGVSGVVPFARAVTEAEAELRGVKPLKLSYALTKNVYAVPAARFEIMHDPDAPVILHVSPPGLA
jgi:hypothetical protein